MHPGRAIEIVSANCDVDVNADVPVLAPDLLDERMKAADALICLLDDTMSEAVMSEHPRLKMIANVAVGYDNVDVEAATRCGILVTNTPGVLDETTADLAFGLILACARRIAEGDWFVRAGRWTGWTPQLMLGADVYGKTLGIVGMGRIGRAVARRAHGFGMKVLYTTRSQPANKIQDDLPDCQWAILDELLSASDYISLHCPLTKETYHLIGERELSLVKPGSILVNTARGAILDQSALVKALESGRLRGAGLDVFEDEPHVPEPLLTLRNVVLTPHVGSASIETRSAMAELAAQGVDSAFSGKLPTNAVNSNVWERFLNRLND